MVEEGFFFAGMILKEIIQVKRIEIGIFRFLDAVNFQAEIIIGISGALYQRPAIS